jgi:drug/metabolite transporter (DMT)-like permease
MLLSLAIAGRIVANPVSNVFQKVLTRRAADPLFVICVTHGVMSVVCLPLAVYCLPVLREGFWSNMAAVAVLTVAGNALLVQAVKRTDLSVLGPVNAYKAVVSVFLAMVLLREFPGAVGVAGMALIVAGSYFVVDKNVSEPGENVFVRFFRDRGVQYRFGALFLSATEAVFLKKALLASSPLATFAFWAVLGFGASIPAVAALIGSRVEQDLRGAWRSAGTYAWLAVTTGVMQFCTIWTFGGFQVGYALALFQTSTLLSVFLGYKVFNEGNIVERLVGSVVMIAGAMLIIFGQ